MSRRSDPFFGLRVAKLLEDSRVGLVGPVERARDELLPVPPASASRFRRRHHLVRGIDVLRQQGRRTEVGELEDLLDGRAGVGEEVLEPDPEDVLEGVAAIKDVAVSLLQWTQAHSHILDGRDAFEDVTRVRFEDLLTDTRSTVQEIVEFADLGASPLLSEYVDAPDEVMTTKEPRRARWRDREEFIAGALDRADDPYTAVVEELGYAEAAEWI